MAYESNYVSGFIQVFVPAQGMPPSTFSGTTLPPWLCQLERLPVKKCCCHGDLDTLLWMHRALDLTRSKLCSTFPEYCCTPLQPSGGLRWVRGSAGAASLHWIVAQSLTPEASSTCRSWAGCWIQGEVLVMTPLPHDVRSELGLVFHVLHYQPWRIRSIGEVRRGSCWWGQVF